HLRPRRPPLSPYTTLFRSVARPATQGFVKDLANEVGPRGIRVNALLPGRFDTERSRAIAAADPDGVEQAKQAAALRRFGAPEELDRKSTRLNSSHVKISYA